MKMAVGLARHGHGQVLLTRKLDGIEIASSARGPISHETASASSAENHKYE